MKPGFLTGGCLLVAVWPLAAPLITVWKAGAEIAGHMLRKPIPATGAMALAGLLWYHSCHTGNLARWGEEARTQIAQAQAVQQYPLEASLAPSSTEEEFFRDAPLSDERHYFYFFRHDDTLYDVATRFTGSPRNIMRIAEDNALEDPARIPTGLLLRIKKELCTTTHGLYEQVPPLEHIVLEGTRKVSEVFGERTPHVLELNRRLGLSYTDEFPLGEGERIVYYSSNFKNSR